jgi:hypothetical protein
MHRGGLFSVVTGRRVPVRLSIYGVIQGVCRDICKSSHERGKGVNRFIRVVASWAFVAAVLVAAGGTTLTGTTVVEGFSGSDDGFSWG